MASYKSMTWKNILKDEWEEIKNFLVSKGATLDEKVTGPQVWRTILAGTVFSVLHMHIVQ